MDLIPLTEIYIPITRIEANGEGKRELTDEDAEVTIISSKFILPLFLFESPSSSSRFSSSSFSFVLRLSLMSVNLCEREKGREREFESDDEALSLC